MGEYLLKVIKVQPIKHLHTQLPQSLLHTLYLSYHYNHFYCSNVNCRKCFNFELNRFNIALKYIPEKKDFDFLGIAFLLYHFGYWGINFKYWVFQKALERGDCICGGFIGRGGLGVITQKYS